LDKETAKKIFDETVRPYKEVWEVLAAERDSLRDQWKAAIEKALEARHKFRDVQKEAKAKYYRDIGE